jgi:hypothetical protein
MSRHSYPPSALLGDYLRAGAGFFPAIAIFAIGRPVGIVEATLVGGFAALFAVFGVRTALRHCTCLEGTEEGLRASGLLRTSISWNELDRMKLAYYSTRRDRREGWMQLELRAGWSTLRVDSRIEGFVNLVRVSAEAAEMRGLSFDPATSVNLQALGIEQRTAVASPLRKAVGSLV